MSLCPYNGRSSFGALSPLLREFYEDSTVPYWRNRHHGLNFNMAQELGAVQNNDQKFAVTLDVSQFKPNELKVSLNGHVLTIEGEHEVKTEHGFTKRSFTRQFTLPSDVDLAAIHSKLSQSGEMSIEVPKTNASEATSRAIPIHTPSGQAITQKPHH